MENAGICYGCMKKIDRQEKVCPYCGFDGNHYAVKFYQLRLGTMLSNRYIVGKMLGEGGFGITYIAWDSNLEIPVAVKEYYPYGLVSRDTTTGNKTVFTMEGSKRESFDLGLTKVINEARRMAKFRNMQGIVTVVDFFKENGTAYIVMEYIEGITFHQYLRENGVMKPETVLTMFQPLIQSLSRVHQSGMIHRDISPDNIMIDDRNEIKLLDFGAARDYGDDEKSLSIMLKRGYAPEEQYRTKGKQGPWTDVYALCATMYKMMTGVTPEESLDRMEEDNLRSLSELSVPIASDVEHVLLKGMEVYGKNRIRNMEELYEGLYGTPESQHVYEDTICGCGNAETGKTAATFTLEKPQEAAEASAMDNMATVFLFENSMKEEIKTQQAENTERNTDKPENIDSKTVTSVIDSKDSKGDQEIENKQKSVTEETDLLKKSNNTLVKRIKGKRMFAAAGGAASVFGMAVVLFYGFADKETVLEICSDTSKDIQLEYRYDKKENIISNSNYAEEGTVESKGEHKHDETGTVEDIGTVSAVATITNPVITADSNLDAGQKVTYSCVWFGSYPQTEIVSKAKQSGVYGKEWATSEDYIVNSSLYNMLKNATGWDSKGDVTINGIKYRRIKQSDATNYIDDSDYFYSWSATTTYHYFKYEPIKWRVLSTNGSSALLLADKGLDNKEYNETSKSVTWETSTIRSWLNGYGSNQNNKGVDCSSKNFISMAFTGSEQAAIKRSSVVNNNNISYGTSAGNNTIDKIFLLSESEVYGSNAVAYGFLSEPGGFAYDEARKSKSTTYAKAMGAYCEMRSRDLGNSDWWLRSSGDRTTFAAYVGAWGCAYDCGTFVESDFCVRPALYLKLSSSNLYSYAGTVCTDEMTR